MGKFFCTGEIIIEENNFGHSAYVIKSGKVPRVTAPFEAAVSFDETGLSPGKMLEPMGREEKLKTIIEQIKESEPASLGGYLLIVMGLF